MVKLLWSIVPSPKSMKGHINIQTTKSLVSVGTERMLVDFGKAGWIEKARSQPDKVKMVLEKVKTDGLSATYDAVKSKLDQPLPLGYCNVGKVLDGSDTGLKRVLVLSRMVIMQKLFVCLKTLWLLFLMK